MNCGADASYTNSLDSRLAELDYLLNNDLADVDCENSHLL